MSNFKYYRNIQLQEKVEQLPFKLHCNYTTLPYRNPYILIKKQFHVPLE